MEKYNHLKIEKRWQKYWRENKVFQPDLKRAKKPFYNLMMFPYLSGEGMHVGNMYAFTGSDIYGRFIKLQGQDLFEPIGLDGFGIHSENFAIKKNTHPAKMAAITKENFYRQLMATGNAYAWENTLETYDPQYYKWTQWIFLQLYKKGLAEQKTAPVNWCPSCKTVLADEQAEAGVCERCKTKVIKKDLRQWFLKITQYAEKLHQDLDKLDWSEKVKIAQKNWIGRSEGSLIKFKLKTENCELNTDIEVFTTRADTLFGVTYLVLAPEHEFVASLLKIKNQKSKIKNIDEIKKYINRARQKSDLERTELAKEKTGVEIKGPKAINPANGEQIPIWVADYVLPNYGTGAVMAVPAHDERDFEFAKKYHLSINEVIIPKVIDKHDPPKNGVKTIFRKAVQVILLNPKNNKVLVLKWKKFPWTTFITGGIEDGEDILRAAKREILEETGYINVKYIKTLGGPVESHFFANHKCENRKAHFWALVFELIGDERKIISDQEKAIHDCVWITWEDLAKDNNIKCAEYEIWLKRLQGRDHALTEDGILVNSGKFNGMSSQKAREAIIKSVGGRKTINYKLRDWLISRQRYWGPPIPLIHCKKCGVVPVPEKDLPVLLPKTKDWHPKGDGQSPLANIPGFVNTVCPKCKSPAKRETDVSDTFLDSAWYFLAYLAKSRNINWRLEIGDWKFRAIARRWLPVDMYIGGAEHSVLHLLYVRFLTYVLHELKLIDFDSPFKKFRAHGLIIKDGAKMSKSRGNVVVPDEYIKKHGADTIRMYLMFLGPFTDGGDFQDSGIAGITRFLEKICKFILEIPANFIKNDSRLHRTVKEVGDDIVGLRYNTAISALMIYVNCVFSGITKIDADTKKTFLILLSPFAPHLAEELWRRFSNKNSIFKERWPKYNKKSILETEATIAIQINGKLRDKLTVNPDTSEKQIIKLALGSPKVAKYILDKNKIKKTIYIPGKILSVVV